MLITNLQLENFKNSRQANLKLGPFSMFVGTNAAEKSNVREAFRFLHGISKGYSVADILTEKCIEGGKQFITYEE